MLSDLYVPADTDPSSPNFSDQSNEEDTQSDTGSNTESDNNEEKEEMDMCAAIKCLALKNSEFFI